MTRLARLLMTTAVSAGTMVTSVLPATAITPHLARSDAFAEVASCISGADNLLVSVVVDESLSLRDTDPHALRVRGITTAIDSLGQLAASADASLNVEMSLSTFARKYSKLTGWRKLTPSTAQQLRATAERTLPDRDTGDATDYRVALQGAKEEIDSRQRQLHDPNACKVLLWFTDGALDVDEQTSTASRELCQTGGVVDAVRRDGINVVALALFTSGAGVTGPQREQLRAAAEGRGAGTTCGTVPLPEDSAAGVYLPANDPAALQRLFAGAGALVAGGTEVDTVTCPGPSCRNGRYVLKIDRGIAGARLLIQSSSAGNTTITSPAGETLRLANGESRQVGQATVSFLQRNQLATFNIELDPYASAAGSWTIKPPTPSRLSLYWFWRAQLTPRNTEVRAGSTSEVTFALQDKNGDPLDPALYRKLRPTVTAGGRELSTSIDGQGFIRAKVKLGVDDIPAQIQLSASLMAASSPGDVKLGPITSSQRVPVSVPPAYPSVSPTKIKFADLEGVGTATASLQLHGSKLGATKVCITGSTVIVPGEQPADLVTSGSDCVDIPADQTKTLQLNLAPKKSADGLATGEVRLKLGAADGGKDIGMQVPLALNMKRKVDESTRWEIIAALVALALLMPAILLLASNILLAKFSIGSMARVGRKSVIVTAAGLRPLQGTTLLEPDDFDNVSRRQKDGRVSVEGTPIKLRARRIFSLKEPEGVATTDSGEVLVSGHLPYRGSRPSEAPAALGQVDATFLLLDPATATLEEAGGTLCMVVPIDVDRQGIHERATRMSTVIDWRDELARIAATQRRREAPTAVPQPETSTEAAWATSDRSEPPSDPSYGSATEDLPAYLRDEDAHEPPAARGKTRRGLRRKDRPPRTSPPATPASSSGDDDDPPLPDFLK